MTNPATIQDRPLWLSDDLFPFKSHFIKINGNHVHYVDEGCGPPLLMVHGNPDWSFLYRELIKGLQGTFRCIAVDFPGFGLSKPAADYQFTPDEHADILDAFIEALDLQQVTVMVQDWGGPLGLGVAGQMPDRIRALIIGSTLAWPDFADHQPLWIKLMMRNFIATSLGRYLARTQNIVAIGAVNTGMMVGRKTPFSKAEKAAYFEPLSSEASRLATWVFPKHLYGGAGKAYLTRVEQNLTRLKDKPVLFLWGTGDESTSVDRELARFKTHFPNHHQVLFDGVGHWWQEAAADEAVQAILDWWPPRITK